MQCCRLGFVQRGVYGVTDVAGEVAGADSALESLRQYPVNVAACLTAEASVPHVAVDALDLARGELRQQDVTYARYDVLRQ